MMRQRDAVGLFAGNSRSDERRMVRATFPAP